MSKSAYINTRIEPHLKQEAEGVLSKLGLSMSDAVTLFLNQTVMHQGLPFDVRIPNSETIGAIQEPRDDLKVYDTASDMMADILSEEDEAA